MIKCDRCEKNLLSHQYKVICNMCNKRYHKTCIGLCRKDTVDRNWSCLQCNENLFPFNSIFDDDEFTRTVRDIQINTDNIENMLFVPFELNDSDNDQEPFDDIDPDTNYFSQFRQLFNTKCKYHHENSFQNTVTKNESLSFFHLNIRSARKNLNSLETYLNTIDYGFSIIGLTETWLNTNNAENFNLKGYEHVYNCRQEKRGGGVSLYLKSELQFAERKDLSKSNSIMESIFVEMDKNSSGLGKKVVIGNIYKPPNTDINEFITQLSPILNKISREKKLFYLMGDFNINLLNTATHGPTQEFINNMYSHSIYPTINKPTRITKYSATLIDNIFTNNVNSLNTAQGILFTDISDHLPVFHIIEIQNNNTVKDKSITVRLMNENRTESFVRNVSDYDWESIRSETDANDSYRLFASVMSKLYNDAFPIRTIRIKHDNRKPWLTEALKVSIKTKNKLFAKLQKTPTSENEMRYKRYRNKLHHLLKITEKSHFQKLFEENKNNAKKSWDIIKDIIGRKKQITSNKSFMSGNKIIENDKEIANGFNKFFVNVGPSLADKIPVQDIEPTSYLGGNFLNTFFLTPCTPDEIISITKNLKNSAAGFDNIKTEIIKHVIHVLSNPLSHIFNLSFAEGTFPDDLKIAKVTPIFKKDDPKYYTNYRPVSVLPMFSKILEKLTYNRLMKYINENNILYKHQFGFRNAYSTYMAMILLEDKITQAMDNGEYTLGLFLDFSKAFDTINHTILMSKLHHYGIRGISLDWFQSYMTNRSQSVTYNGYTSTTLPITCGVPQGSILGPLLFLLYINDLCLASPRLFSIIFADDTNMFVSGKNPHQLATIMNSELEKVTTWLKVNKLSLNIEKTHYILFSGKRKKSQNVMIKIDGKEIVKTTSTKFLGIQIDEHLTWNNHILNIGNKMAKGLGIIYKAKQLVNSNTIRLLYYSFIYPYLIYCNHVWGNTYKTSLNPVKSIQKRAVKLIGNKYVEENDDEDENNEIREFKDQKLLPLAKVNTLQIATFMYRYSHSLLPNCFDTIFQKNNNQHGYYTRHRNDMRTPKHHTNYVKYSIRHTGPQIWNSVPADIKCLPNIHAFKAKMKTHLLDLP